MEDDLWVPPYWWKPPYDPMFDDFWAWGHGSGGYPPNTFSELSKSVADFDWRHELLEFEWLPLWWGLGVEKCSSCKYAFYVPFRASQLRWASFSALLLKNQPLPHEIMTFRILATTYMRRRLRLSILWLWLYVYTLYNTNANMIFCDMLFRCFFGSPVLVTDHEATITWYWWEPIGIQSHPPVEPAKAVESDCQRSLLIFLLMWYFQVLIWYLAPHQMARTWESKWPDHINYDRPWAQIAQDKWEQKRRLATSFRAGARLSFSCWSERYSPVTPPDAGRFGRCVAVQLRGHHRWITGKW